MNDKKILVICPIVPYPENGAEQLDRANGIRQLIRLGYNLRIIAKRRHYQKDSDIENFSQMINGTTVITIPYKTPFFDQPLPEKIGTLLRRFSYPPYLDGAAFEFSDSETRKLVDQEIKEWQPDLIWFEYTYLWPLYHIVQKHKLPIVTRSINYEPTHFLDENGKNIVNYIKVLPKYLSERTIVSRSDLVCAITPFEECIYKKLGARKVITLPLRGLHNLPVHVPRSREIFRNGPLNIFFMGSTYNVSHNIKAVAFIVYKLAPALLKISADRFHIHITGAKLPISIRRDIPRNVTYEGFVNNLDDFLENMDVGLAPSFFGAGMQQKIFEPLMRGFPVVTSKRGTAGYKFEEKKEIYYADSLQDFIYFILKLNDNYDKMVLMGKKAREKSSVIFDRNAVDCRLKEAIKSVLL